MMKSKYIIAVILAVGLFAITADAKSIQMPEYWTEYQDYLGNTYRYTNVNLSQHPYYIYDFSGSNATFTTSGTTISVPKANTTFELGLDRVSPKLTYSKSFLQSKMINVNSTVAYIKVPYSVIGGLDYEDSTKIKKGRWLFNAGNNHISIYDDNTTRNYLNDSAYEFKIVNKEIRLYFLKVEANKLQGNITFKIRTWIIDNATTSGWTSNNVSTNAYYSAYKGGSLGTPLNQSIHDNLSLYVDCEATSGNIQYGINRYGRFPNTSIQGAWHGNATLNYTAGRDWGSACNLDGNNDYYLFNVERTTTTGSAKFTFIPSINFTGGVNIYGFIDFFNAVNDDLFIAYYQPQEKIFAIFKGILYAGTQQTRYNTTEFYDIQYTQNGTQISVYNNNVMNGSSITTDWWDDIAGNSVYLGTRGDIQYFGNESIDEIIISLSSAEIFSNSTYATSHYINLTNQTASAGKVITGVRFNVPYINSLNNTGNISVRQNGTLTWSLISENYQNWTWANFTQTWNNGTDILFEGFGNGSSRMFVVNGDVQESQILSGYVNNTLGLPIENCRVDASGNFDYCDSNGYYSLSSLNGAVSVLVRAIGYQNLTETVTISGDTSHNFVLLENAWSTEAQTLEAGSLGLIGGILGGILAIGVMRRRNRPKGQVQ